MAFDLEAFAAWLVTRDVPEEQRGAYRKHAERVAERAKDGPILREHVEQVIAEEREGGASPRTLANVRKIGLDLLRFEHERLHGGPQSKTAETYRSPPEESRPVSENVRFKAPVVLALKIGAAIAAITLVIMFAYRRLSPTRGAADVHKEKLGTLTMLSGAKCRIAGVRFRYEYSYTPGAPPGFIVIAPVARTERAFDETLHAAGFDSIARSSIRQIRFFGAENQPLDPKRVSYSEVEVITDNGSYSFVAQGGKLLVGDGSRVWPSGSSASRAPSVLLDLETADGSCPSVIDLTTVEQSARAAAVRLELP